MLTRKESNQGRTASTAPAAHFWFSRKCKPGTNLLWTPFDSLRLLILRCPVRYNTRLVQCRILRSQDCSQATSGGEARSPRHIRLVSLMRIVVYRLITPIHQYTRLHYIFDHPRALATATFASSTSLGAGWARSRHLPKA